jgi:hypothetical protein
MVAAVRGILSERCTGAAFDVVRRCKSDARPMRVFARERRRHLVRCAHHGDRRGSDSAVSRMPPTGMTAGSAVPSVVATFPRLAVAPIGHPADMERESHRTGASMTTGFGAPRGWCRSKPSGESTPVSRWETGWSSNSGRIQARVLAYDRQSRQRAVPKTSHHSRQSFAAADEVRAGEKATVWPSECCPWSVSQHSIGRNRCG